MGTTVEVMIEVGGKNSREITGKFFERVKELEDKFSLYNPESEIVKVNGRADKRKTTVSPEFFRLIEKCLVYSEISSGAFDISVSPLVKLWAFDRQEGAFPEKSAVYKTLKKCGYGSIVLSPRNYSISFSKKGMEIDLNAIVKGYIVGEGIKLLRKEGVKAGLVNAGGDICCIGAPAGKRGWRVAIRHPRNKNKIIASLIVSDKAIATSGDYENFFIKDGKYFSHIIDPRTGFPADKGVVSATVISGDSAEADALATALIVMGKEKGLDLINNLDGVESIIVAFDKGRLNASVSFGLEGKIKITL